jgi:rRNA maturation endonuclease Nob1
MFKAGSKEARAYGLPVNDVLRDMGDAPEILARFGVANRKEFAVSSAKARSYGLTIKEVNAAFGKQLDTFEGSSMAAAKLNAVFGTNINSLKLMMEHDPTKRMEMVRGSLLKQGKEWENLSVAERNVITQTLGVDEAQAQLVLSSDKARKSLEAQALKKRRAIKDDEKWNDGIRSIQKTLLNWGAHLDRIMRKVSDLVSRIFGFEDGSDVVQKFVDMTVSGLDKVSGAIDWADESVTSIKKALKDGGEDFGFFGKMAVLAFKSLKLGASIVIKPFELWWAWTKKVVGMVGSLFSTIIEGWKNIGSWIGPIIDHLSGNKLGSFDMEGFGKSIVTDLNKGIDEAMETIDDDKIIAPEVTEATKVESKTPKKVGIEASKKKAKVIDKEKVAKLKEDRKKQEDESHKKLASAIGDVVAKKISSEPFEIVINVDGSKRIVKAARGGA